MDIWLMARLQPSLVIGVCDVICAVNLPLLDVVGGAFPPACQVCPYYGSRRAVPSADVVLAPYSAVLMPDARESLGIDLQDSVLVFDEAHNLLDAINSAHSTSVSGELSDKSP